MVSWFEIKDNLWFIGGMILACVTFTLWVLGVVILILPSVYAMNYGIAPPPMTMGRFVISFIFLSGGTICFIFLKKMSES